MTAAAKERAECLSGSDGQARPSQGGAGQEALSEERMVKVTSQIMGVMLGGGMEGGWSGGSRKKEQPVELGRDG